MKINILGKHCFICKSSSRITQNNLFDDRYGAPGQYSVYKCSNCGFGRLIAIIDRNKIGQFYAKYYPLNLMTAEQVKKEVNIKPNWLAWLTGTNNIAHWLIEPKTKVLDIGSASGVSLMEIKKMGGTAYGIEPNHNAIKIAKKLKLQIYQGFITDNPFPGKKFDYITASQVIEHEQDPRRFLKVAAKRLDQGGKIILSFPNADSIYSRIFGRNWINWHVPYHLNYFTENSFYHLAKQTGLKVISKITVTPNLWTLLQLRMSFNKVQEGEKNPIWSASLHKNTDKGSSLLSRYRITFLKLLVIIIMVPITVVNRVVDLFEQGDSFVVILEKKSD